MLNPLVTRVNPLVTGNFAFQNLTKGKSRVFVEFTGRIAILGGKIFIYIYTGQTTDCLGLLPKHE